VSGLSLLLFLLLVGLELDFHAVGVWPWAPADVRGRLAAALGGHARLTCPSSSRRSCHRPNAHVMPCWMPTVPHLEGDLLMPITVSTEPHTDT